MLISLLLSVVLNYESSVSIRPDLHGVKLYGTIQFLDLRGFTEAPKNEISSVMVVPIVNSDQNFLAISSPADKWILHVGERVPATSDFYRNMLVPRSPLLIKNFSAEKSVVNTTYKLFYVDVVPIRHNKRCYYWQVTEEFTVKASGTLEQDKSEFSKFTVETETPAKYVSMRKLNADEAKALSNEARKTAISSWTLVCEAINGVPRN